MTSRQRIPIVLATALTAVSYATFVVLLLVIGARSDDALLALGVVGLVALVATALAAAVLVQDFRRRANAQATRSANLERRLAGVTATTASAEALALLEGRLAELDARLAAHAQRAPADPRVDGLLARLDELAERVIAAEQRPVADTRVDQLTARVDGLEVAGRTPHPVTTEDVYELTESLATVAERTGLPLHDLLSRRQATQQVRAAVAHSAPLDTIRLLDAHPDLVSNLSLTESRRLMKRLRQLGFMSQAVVLMRSIAERFGKPEDAHAAALMASEIDLYSGRVLPDVAMPPLEGPTNPTTVMHVVGSAMPDRQSGYTLRTQYTVEAQARAGVTPVVVTQSGTTGRPSERTETYVHGGVRYFSLRGPLRGAVTWHEWIEANVVALAEVVAMVRPAALHVHSDFINAVIAHPVARHHGIPLVNETRGFWEESWLSRTATAEGWNDLDDLTARVGLPDVYRLRLEQEARMRSVSSAVVTLARVMRSHIDDVAAELDLPVPAVSIAPNAVDADEFPVVEPNLALREELGFEPGTRVVGYISSIVEYEGIDTLVRAMADVEVALDALRVTEPEPGSEDEDAEPEADAVAPVAVETLAQRLRRHHPTLDDESLELYADDLAQRLADLAGTPVRLVVVGDGAELPNLQVLAQSLGTSSITFTGRVPHDTVLGYYAAIDLFVVPRKRAAVTELVTPLKPYEALSTGRACLFSDVAALAEIATDSGAAELFRADDVRHLALTVATLLTDPDRMAEMSRRGAEWVRRERTWDHNASVYLDVYRSLGLELPEGRPVDEQQSVAPW